MIEQSQKQDNSTALPDFGGVYVKLTLISERQMTCAFSAEDAPTSQPVFIKMLRESKVGDEIAERLFANEVGLLQFINKQSSTARIVTLIDTGICGARPYFVQPLLSGFTLRSALRAHPVLAGQSAVKLIEGCLEFLATLHTLGVAHGDVSPDNIFIETEAALTDKGRLPDQFRIRLLDYNSARRIDGPENKSARLVFLKLPYAAPELARGLPMSAQSDLYSLGVVFYEAVTGARPYHVKKMSDVAELRENAIPPIPLAFDVPRSVETFIRSLVRPDPRARSQSVGEALQSLRELKAVYRWLSQIETPLPSSG